MVLCSSCTTAENYETALRAVCSVGDLNSPENPAFGPNLGLLKPLPALFLVPLGKCSVGDLNPRFNSPCIIDPVRSE